MRFDLDWSFPRIKLKKPVGDPFNANGENLIRFDQRLVTDPIVTINDQLVLKSGAISAGLRLKFC